MTRAFVSWMILFSCLCVTEKLDARVIEGEGYGSTVKRAKVTALSALANSIYVNVESKSSVHQDNNGTNDFSFQANLSTNLPILGVKYRCIQTAGEHFCSASLDSKSALSLYETEILAKVKHIDSMHASLPSLEQNAQLDTLYSILAQLDQYDKLGFVLRYLSGNVVDIPKPSVSVQQINSSIIKLEHSVSSIEIAAKLISRQIKQEKVYIAPVTLANSREVTPFSSALVDEIKTQVSSVKNRNRAHFYLTGSYEENSTGIRVNYNLSDLEGNTVLSIVVGMLPQSYQDYRTKPLAPDFDQLLHHGYVVSDEFKTSLATNKGIRNLAFRAGEQVELLMKMNSPGYFYLVGHTKNWKQEQSYLVELNDAAGDRRFIGYINADDVNKWISLGEFIVEKPFGIESIQLMASTHDLVGMLPSYRYVSSSGYYVIAYEIEQGVRLTRGLKKVKKVEVSNTESVLLFTTENK